VGDATGVEAGLAAEAAGAAPVAASVDWATALCEKTSRRLRTRTGVFIEDLLLVPDLNLYSPAIQKKLLQLLSEKRQR
jgi:hypothetical protein